MEKLKAQLRQKEADTLERLIGKSLVVLTRVLESKEALVQAGLIDASAISSLEHFLLSIETIVSAAALHAAEDLQGHPSFQRVKEEDTFPTPLLISCLHHFHRQGDEP